MTRSPLTIQAAGRSDVGRERQNNEDRLVVVEPDEHDAGWILCVADGMGGHPAGEEASGHVVELIAAFPREEDLPDPGGDRGVKLARALAATFERAHREVLAIGAGDPEKTGLGTTVVAAHLVEGELHVFHCGDSRCYLLREEILEQLTSDHVVVDGGIRFLAAHVGMAEGFVLEHARRDLEPGDRILVCSDGLTDMVPAEVFGLALHEAPDPEQAVLTLVEMALLAGGHDNVSVAVAFVS
ncbi:MAG: protein phosphatase 2C domain-containing protein [Deltaproteobacteria bacterium]|nr:protein phosphatase 2C domain-containing protein [Deltaproteobacteria bacterium]